MLGSESDQWKAVVRGVLGDREAVCVCVKDYSDE